MSASAPLQQLERTVSISYRWWRDDGEVLPHHENALDESAMSRIRSLMAEGFTSGELADNVHTANDPEDGVDYRGHWEVKSH